MSLVSGAHANDLGGSHAAASGKVRTQFGALTIAKVVFLTLHTLVMLRIVLASYKIVGHEDLGAWFLLGQLLFGSLVYVAIFALQDLSQLVYPTGGFLVYSYLAYFLKSYVFVVDEGLFFRNWITQNSPMAYATFGDWANAVVLTSVGIGFFAALYTLTAAASPFRRSFRDPIDTRQSSGPMNGLLLLAVCFLLLRAFVTMGLGIGASYNASQRLFWIPGLAGLLQLLSLWGSRLVLATAFAFAATAQSTRGILSTLVLTMLIGGIGTAATGSKSEFMLPFVILMVVCVYLRDWMPSQLRYGSLVVGATLVLGAIFVYPAMHNYRYVRAETSLTSFLLQNTDEMGLQAGGKDVLRRLNGIELVSLVQTYQEMDGPRPKFVTNYQPSIKQLFGIPVDHPISVGLGCFGGLLFVAGGAWGYLGLCAGLGVVLRMAEWCIDRLFFRCELRAAVLATAALWTSDALKFSGNLTFLAKECVAIGITIVIIWTVIKMSEKDGLDAQGLGS